MAITYIGHTEAPDTQGVSSVTTSLTPSAGSNRALYCCVQFRTGDGKTPFVSTIVYNGSENFVFEQFDNRGATPFWRTEIWSLVNPTVTTANAVVTFSDTVSDAIGITYVELQGVHQTTPTNAKNGSNNSGTTLSASVTSTVDNCLYLDSAIGRDDAGVTPDASQTAITQRIIGASPPSSVNEGAGVSRFAQSTAGAKTMQWTQATSTDWTLSIVAIQPAATSTTSPPMFAGH